MNHQGMGNMVMVHESPEELLRKRIAEIDGRLQSETVEALQERRKKWAEALSRAREALVALTGEVL